MSAMSSGRPLQLVESTPAADPAPLGTTAFSTYGAFWMAFGLFVILALNTKFLAAYATNDLNHAAAWFLISFAIFNTYMLIASMRVSDAVFMVFLTFEVTEIMLAIGYFNLAHGGTPWILHAGGWAGIVTAGVAWYASAAGVWNGVAGRVMLPVGKPLAPQSRTAAMA